MIESHKSAYNGLDSRDCDCLLCIYLLLIYFKVKGTEQNSSLSSMDIVKGLTAFMPEMDCYLTAMGLPPVTSGVFLIVNSF
jgi:hypothetical protein